MNRIVFIYSLALALAWLCHAPRPLAAADDHRIFIEEDGVVDFEKLSRNETKPLIVNFDADWCGPCRMLSPVLEELARDHHGKVIVCRVNADVCPAECRRWNVTGIPTTMIWRQGKLVNRFEGVVPKKRIEEACFQ